MIHGLAELSGCSGFRPRFERLQSAAEEDGEALVVGVFGAVLELFLVGAADGVVQEGEGEVGEAEGFGDHLAGGLEGGGAEDQGGFAGLLEDDAVMHTACGAGASIADGGDEEIDVLGGVLEELGVGDAGGIGLAGVPDDLAAVVAGEFGGGEAEELVGVDFAVGEEADAEAVERLEARGAGVAGFGGGSGRVEQFEGHVRSPCVGGSPAGGPISSPGRRRWGGFGGSSCGRGSKRGGRRSVRRLRRQRR